MLLYALTLIPHLPELGVTLLAVHSLGSFVAGLVVILGAIAIHPAADLIPGGGKADTDTAWTQENAGWIMGAESGVEVGITIGLLGLLGIVLLLWAIRLDSQKKEAK